MDITVNGSTRSVPDATTVASLATAMVGSVHDGIAIAVNGTVVPAGSWAARTVQAGDRIDVITALQGG